MAGAARNAGGTDLAFPDPRDTVRARPAAPDPGTIRGFTDPCRRQTADGETVADGEGCLAAAVWESGKVRTKEGVEGPPDSVGWGVPPRSDHVLEW